MKCIFFLSGDYLDLAKEEVISIFNIAEFRLLDRLMIADLKNSVKSLGKLIKKLALTKNIYKLLFECKIYELTDLMKEYDWDSIYRGNFCLRMHYFNNNNEKSNKKLINKNIKKNKKQSNVSEQITRSQLTEKNLAEYVWRSVKNPKVDLKNPKTKIELFIIGDNAYCGLLIFENNQDFKSRKSHLRPFSHPSSLHPKLARALVNLIGIKEDEIMLDPFCGTGGFLIEAGLMGIKVVGYDISKNMVRGCKENLKHFRIKNSEIINKNALKINKKFDYVVTDLPYGLNSNVYPQYNKNSLKYKSNKINLKINKIYAIKNLEQFYLKFLKTLRKTLKKKAVVIFPSYVNYRRLLKISKFKIEKEFSIYVHRSLTRKIVKIE